MHSCNKAVEITRKRIFEVTGYWSDKIICSDFLQYSLTTDGRNFDYIFTNPPWGKKLSKLEKNIYSQYFNLRGSTDTCSLFVSAALKNLVDSGLIGFLLPESYFNIGSFESSRRQLMTLKIIALSNYGRAFDGLLTEAQSFVAKNVRYDRNTSNSIKISSLNRQFNRCQSSFLNNPKTIVNLNTNNEESKIIDYMYGMEHTTLRGNARWGLGIVTGNNKKFMSSSPKSGYVPIFRGSDILQGGLKKPTRFVPSDFSQYQQVAPLEIYHASPKIAYKFISNRICLYVDRERKYFLNSANLFVLNSEFGLNECQVASLLNSDVVNWLFKNVFNSHKILRKDLEALPLHYSYFENNTDFTEDSYLSFLGLIKNENGTYRIKK